VILDMKLQLHELWSRLQKVRYCTAGRALRVSIVMVVGCLLLGSMQLYLWTYDSSKESCLVRPSASGGSGSLFSVWSWVTEMMIFLVVPVVILIVNVFVMREVRLRKNIADSPRTTSYANKRLKIANRSPPWAQLKTFTNEEISTIHREPVAII